MISVNFHVDIDLTNLCRCYSRNHVLILLKYSLTSTIKNDFEIKIKIENFQINIIIDVWLSWERSINKKSKNVMRFYRLWIFVMIIDYCVWCILKHFIWLSRKCLIINVSVFVLDAIFEKFFLIDDEIIDSFINFKINYFFHFSFLFVDDYREWRVRIDLFR